MNFNFYLLFNKINTFKGMVQFLQASGFFPRKALLSRYPPTVMPSTMQAIFSEFALY